MCSQGALKGKVIVLNVLVSKTLELTDVIKLRNTTFLCLK